MLGHGCTVSIHCVRSQIARARVYMFVCKDVCFYVECTLKYVPVFVVCVCAE